MTDTLERPADDPGLLGLPADGPAAPRLLGLRLHGFKSFAERTAVEFGSGISAVVGPNGSGKSNLADALRWALGEQGRALRSRKAEDVIWAGSEKRAAQGMADVTLVVDNHDGLLPVEYEVLELGRRLFRSGENDYLLNKQRIRLRDLVDLLDGAHLADNAFLFIGQGMVDQALALRPEERRPLFEEVAGVRRHERRRRKAEEQLIESEANLARVEDILAELRPQARRLAAQAEQQASRTSVGEELAAAVLASAHERWHAASGRSAEVATRRDAAQREADRAMADLEAAETAARTIADGLTARAEAERERRATHERAQAALTGLRLREGRVESELEAIERDRRRLVEERRAAEAEAAAQRRAIAAPIPTRDLDLEAAVTEAERELADALAELATLRSASQARGEELAAIRRAAAARQAETETARRRLAESERRLDEERQAAATVADRRDEAERRHVESLAALEEARSAESRGVEAREALRVELEATDADRIGAAERVAAASATVAAVRGRLEALSARLEEDETRPIARAARKVGGRRADDELAVDPAFRGAVEAALADRARGYVVAAAAVPELVGERGRLLVEERVTPADRPLAASERAVLDTVRGFGGGSLADAVRREATGVIRRLLGRAMWTPDLSGALELQDRLPPGWIVVTRDGSAVVDETGVTLGAPDGLLERRAEHARLAEDLAVAMTAAEAASAAGRTAADAATAARLRLEDARRDEARLGSERRAAETAERRIAGEVDGAAREAAWHDAQVVRLEGEVERLRHAVEAQAEEAPAPTMDDTTASALTTWETRAGELRERRDRLAERLAVQDADRRSAEHRRARAEASAAMADDRMQRADREAATLVDREDRLQQERDEVRSELATAVRTEAAAAEALRDLHAADAADRARLQETERAATAARERLRTADERLRAADHAALESRLGLEALRESVLVELAGMGALGRRVLGLPASRGVVDTEGVVGAPDTLEEGSWATEPGDADETAGLGPAFDDLAAGWAAAAPTVPAPSLGRLAQLRRRFHELGAADPNAVGEYELVKARLDQLEGQAGDLRTAIARTRELIAELDGLIADQFRTTFAKLETAFERRFGQLFGGGFARLSLTDPNDLGATGIEIVARPPGKKPQALAMLSGGERALTAVALLFSMLEVRPVPFCVLDEVDAALDEANIGRFGDALRSLAHQTQFIVITHNRGTIEAADALYGVTVGDDSVSRVISLRLEEARAIAGQQASAGVGAG